MNCNQKKCQYNSELDTIRAIDFALQETVLYLDAYPNNCEALEFYHTLLKEREQAVLNYQKRNAPLTMYGNMSHTSWDWIKGPWPWELDAN